MAEAASQYGLWSRIAGWGVMILYSINAWITITLPRTAKELPLREELRDWHFTVGVLLLLFSAARLALWVREGPVAPYGRMRRSGHAFARLFTLTTYVFIFVTCLLGIGFAWGSGYDVRFLGVQVLPTLFEDNYRLWKFAGYFHSGVSFTMLFINIVTLTTATYFVLRYDAPWLRVYPEPFVLQAFFAFTMTTYALINTGFSKAPGVQILWGLAAVLVALSVWKRRAARVRAAQA